MIADCEVVQSDYYFKADLNDSVLPSGVITRAAAMRLLMHLGQSASNIVSSLPTVAVQDVSSSKVRCGVCVVCILTILSAAVLLDAQERSWTHCIYARRVC